MKKLVLVAFLLTSCTEVNNQKPPAVTIKVEGLKTRLTFPSGRIALFDQVEEVNGYYKCTNIGTPQEEWLFSSEERQIAHGQEVEMQDSLILEKKEGKNYGYKIIDSKSVQLITPESGLKSLMIQTMRDKNLQWFKEETNGNYVFHFLNGKKISCTEWDLDFFSTKDTTISYKYAGTSYIVKNSEVLLEYKGNNITRFYRTNCDSIVYLDNANGERKFFSLQTKQPISPFVDREKTASDNTQCYIIESNIVHTIMSEGNISSLVVRADKLEDFYGEGITYIKDKKVGYIRQGGVIVPATYNFIHRENDKTLLGYTDTKVAKISRSTGEILGWKDR
jgi:hypothetical protein